MLFGHLFPMGFRGRAKGSPSTVNERVVAVTGAAGFIGRACLKALADQDAHVIAIDKVPGAGSGEWRRVDLRNSRQTAKALTGATHLIHLAGWPSPNQASATQVLSDNTLIASNVFEAFVTGNAVTAAVASSVSVYGFAWAPQVQAPDFVPVTESHPCRPQDTYSLSKLVLEEICAMWARISGVTTVALRLPFVSNDEPTRGNFFDDLSKDPIGETGRRHLWTHLPVDQAALALVQALNVNDGGAHVLNTGSPVSLEDWDRGTLIKRCFPSTVVYGANEAQGFFDTSSAQELLS